MYTTNTWILKIASTKHHSVEILVNNNGNKSQRALADRGCRLLDLSVSTRVTMMLFNNSLGSSCLENGPIIIDDTTYAMANLNQVTNANLSIYDKHDNTLTVISKIGHYCLDGTLE